MRKRERENFFFGDKWSGDSLTTNHWSIMGGFPPDGRNITKDTKLFTFTSERGGNLYHCTVIIEYMGQYGIGVIGVASTKQMYMSQLPLPWVDIFWRTIQQQWSAVIATTETTFRVLSECVVCPFYHRMTDTVAIITQRNERKIEQQLN